MRWVIAAVLVSGCSQQLVADRVFACEDDCSDGWRCQYSSRHGRPICVPSTDPLSDVAYLVPASPVKVDFLFVIDDSASMCQEQAAVAKSADVFLARVQKDLDLDYRIAVVTTDVLSEEKMGKFQAFKTTEYPYACAEGRSDQCLPDASGDAFCEGAYGAGWTCDGPDKPKQVVNCNGSVNSKCKKQCAEDIDCDLDPELGGGGDRAAKCAADASACAYKCVKPSGGPTNTGCVLRPPTATCPDTESLQAKIAKDTGGLLYLTRNTAPDLLKCVAVVGAQQHNNANLESGLAASLLALERSGPNGEQAKGFLRDDAALVILYLSDEEDCSTAQYSGPACDSTAFSCGRTLAGLNRLKKEQYGTCACLTDTDDPTTPGPMLPVSEAANRVKSLKSDPGRVLVAAIVGDSLATDPTEKLADQDGYHKSKCSQCDDPAMAHPLLYNTYICDSAAGKADYGGRYLRFVEQFGKNGIAANICSPDGVGQAFTTIADRVNTLVRIGPRVCLPRPPTASESLVVRLIPGCPGACTPAPGAPLPAEAFQILDTAECLVVALHDPVAAGTTVEIAYSSAAP